MARASLKAPLPALPSCNQRARLPRAYCPPMNRQKAIALVGHFVMVDVKGGQQVEAKLLTEPDKGGNVQVLASGIGERTTNITQLHVRKERR